MENEMKKNKNAIILSSLSSITPYLTERGAVNIMTDISEITEEYPPPASHGLSFFMDML